MFQILSGVQYMDQLALTKGHIHLVLTYVSVLKCPGHNCWKQKILSECCQPKRSSNEAKADIVLAK